MFLSKLSNGLPVVLWMLAAGSRYAAGFTTTSAGAGAVAVARPTNMAAIGLRAKNEKEIENESSKSSTTATMELEQGDDTTTASSKEESADELDSDLDLELDSEFDFDAILRSRRTINSFRSDLPNDWEATLETAIESAMYAPNHKRTEPWKFHLLGPEAIRKVCDLNASIVATKKGPKAGQAKLERWLQMPGWLVVTCGTPPQPTGMDEPAGLAREDYAAVCCAVQNLCLSLHHAGMGTKWTTGPVNFDERFGTIVGLHTDEYVVGTIWFGTPAKQPEVPVKKKNLHDVLLKTS